MTGFQLGIDHLLSSNDFLADLRGRRVGLVAHPASVSFHNGFVHSMEALRAAGVHLTCAFGPQHGIRGDLQDNMQETAHEIDPVSKVPVFSLYGEVRRPTPEMLEHFDVLLFDLQDVGTRIYTFLTTLIYLIEDCAKAGKELWVLDRPNPIGRPVEGNRITREWLSFVGAAEGLPMRHGMTLAEVGKWYIEKTRLDLAYRVIPMRGWNPEKAPGYGWPVGEIPWINPSPNAPTLSMARCFPGTVMLEGTHLSEGRGTTRPLEVIAAPDFPTGDVLRTMQRLAPEWLKGCRLRETWILPTFQKHTGKICSGIQIHVDDIAYRHGDFKPWRLLALALKSLRIVQPDAEIWRSFPYEYEYNRRAFDLINGGPFLREWIDDPKAVAADLEARVQPEESAWAEEIRSALIY